MKKESTEQINVRVPKSLNGTINAIANAKNIYTSEVIITLLRIGLENTKYTDEEINKNKELYLKYEKLERADFELKIVMKTEFMLYNFEQLNREIKNKSLGKEQKTRIMKGALKRIEQIFGKESDEYKKAKEISKLE